MIEEGLVHGHAAGQIVRMMVASFQLTPRQARYDLRQVQASWRREDDAETTARKDSVAAHLDKLLATVRERFIPGTHLIRYGEGDWNDSLQPADPNMRDWMVSSWTVALAFQERVAFDGADG